MKLFSFLHASDIHLDTPFINISSSLPQEFATRLRHAPFNALENLLHLAIEKEVDFVLLSGDIYNGEEKSIAGQIALQKFAKELDKHKISLFIIAGNHDPLYTTKYQLEYPDNTVFFSTEYHVVAYEKNNETLAYIHGISHASKDEKRPLAEYYTTAFDEQAFHIAMLHCTVQSTVQEKGKKQYVPCTLDELQRKQIHYWALGHIHTRAILSEYPHIVYSGNTQGLKSSEEGLRGAYHVEVTQDRKLTLSFLPTSAVVFESLIISLEEEDTLGTFFTKIQEAIHTYITTTPHKSHTIFSLVVQGRTELDSELRRYTEEELIEQLYPSLCNAQDYCIQSITIATQNIIPLEELRQREDLLGEAMRIIQSIQQDEQKKQILLDNIKEQIGTSFKMNLLKNIPISIDDILEKIQTETPYLFIEGK